MRNNDYEAMLRERKRRKKAVANVFDQMVTTCKGDGCSTKSTQAVFKDGYCPVCQNKALEAQQKAQEHEKYYLSLTSEIGDFS